MRLLAKLVTLLIAVGTSTAAWAHAALISVEPARGSMLASAPKAVELRFNEAVTPGAIQLIDGTGRARDDARVTTLGESISIAMPPDLPKGTAVVSYRVISQDGHPVAGSVIFSIGMPTGTQPPPNVDGGLNALIWLARVGLYLGLFVGVGGVFFGRWIAWSMTGMGVPRAALLVGLPSAVVSLGVLGLDLLGLPPTALLSKSPWTIAFATSAGPALLVAIAAMLLALMALGRAGYARALAAIAFHLGHGIVLAALRFGLAPTRRHRLVVTAVGALVGTLAFAFGAHGAIALATGWSPLALGSEPSGGACAPQNGTAP